MTTSLTTSPISLRCDVESEPWEKNLHSGGTASRRSKRDGVNLPPRPLSIRGLLFRPDSITGSYFHKCGILPHLPAVCLK